MRRVELLELVTDDEFGAARVVCPEEDHLAVVERASQREDHRVRSAALRLERIAHGPEKGLLLALEGGLSGDEQVLRLVEEARKNRPPEFALGLFARKLRRAFACAFRDKDGLLDCALAPFLNRLRLADHHDARTVFGLGHVGIASADHLADCRVELMDVRRPQQDTGEAAFRDAVEIALGRLALDLLRVVVVA